jgi:exopolysaccharide biosynthesis polyprenyl glycosylphosphotransferase
MRSRAAGSRDRSVPAEQTGAGDGLLEPRPLSSTTPLPVVRRDVPWARRYAQRLAFTDALIAVVTLLGFRALLLESLGATLSWPGGPTLPYWVPLTLVSVLWLLCLEVFDTRDQHIVGHGVAEYRRIVNATFMAFAIVVIVAFFLRIDVARTLFLVALPVGLVLLLTSRWVWRQWLRRRQREGKFSHRAVVLGERSKIEHIVAQIRRTHGTGFLIVGAITPRGSEDTVKGVPVLGTIVSAAEAMDAASADTLIIGGADELDPDTMRRLGWAMADREINWVVAPALTDIAGPRIHARPVAGLPLVHVDFPRLEGYHRLVKRIFDVVAAALLLVLFSPVILVAAVAIRVDGPGPIFYSQQRVGRRGETFSMFKLRSMVAGADDQLSSLLDLQGTSTRPFFKVTDDHRITRVGRYLRRHSIDELPQLVNVLAGHMSLVGPRPQRPEEVALYDDTVARRLLVKPGMSGMWQVSGRSALTWEDSLRLDLYYVENWSFMQDLTILFRTVRTVMSPGDTAH